jgi:two-component system response regulator FixJ
MRSTVVIIDDDEGASHSLRWLVQSAGYTAACYPSGRAYLEAATAENRPACVILDVHMPGMNGPELYPLLKDRYPGIPVVFVTGYPDQALARKARALQPAGFFAKPLDTEALLRQIKDLVKSDGQSPPN